MDAILRCKIGAAVVVFVVVFAAVFVIVVGSVIVVGFVVTVFLLASAFSTATSAVSYRHNGRHHVAVAVSLDLTVANTNDITKAVVATTATSSKQQ